MLPQRPSLLVLLATLLVISQAANDRFLQSEREMADHVSDTKDVDADDMDSEDVDADSEDDTGSAEDISADDNKIGAEDGKADDADLDGGASDDEDEEVVKTDAEEEEAATKDNDKIMKEASLAINKQAASDAQESRKIAAELAEAKAKLRNAEADSAKTAKATNIIAANAVNLASQKTFSMDGDKDENTEGEIAGIEHDADAKDADEVSEDDSEAEEEEESGKAEESEERAKDKSQEKKKADKSKGKKKAKSSLLQKRDDDGDEDDYSEEASEESYDDDGSEDSSASSDEEQDSASDEEEYNEEEVGLDGSDSQEGEQGEIADHEDGSHAEEHTEGKQESHNDGTPHLAEQGILTDEEAHHVVLNAEDDMEHDIGLNEQVEMDGTDAEAEAIAKMASAKNPDEELESQMNANSEGDAAGEYEGLDSSEEEDALAEF